MGAGLSITLLAKAWLQKDHGYKVFLIQLRSLKVEHVWVKSSALKYSNYTQLLCLCPGVNWSLKVICGLHDI